MARFFGRILSPISKPAPKRADNNIAKLTTVDDVEFVDSNVERIIAVETMGMFHRMVQEKAYDRFNTLIFLVGQIFT